MTGFRALLRKEFLELVATPVTYGVVAVFWLASGYLFSFSLFFTQTSAMVNAFHNLSLLLLLLAPILTMRSLAEEESAGTLELLFALPLNATQMVAAKYCVLLFLLLLLLVGSGSAVVPLLLFAAPDWGPIVGGYLGLFLYGAALLALGLVVSSWARTQVMAAVATWGLLLGLWFVDYGAHVARDSGDAWIATLLSHLSFSLHVRSVIRGVLDGASAVYFISIAALATVWAAQILRWRRS